MRAALLGVLRRWSLMREVTWVEICAALFILGIEGSAGYGRVVADDAGVYRALVLCNALVITAFALRSGARALRDTRVLLKPATFIALVMVGGLVFVSPRLAGAAAIIHDFFYGWSWIRRERPGDRVLADVGYRPARSLVYSFVGLIAVGTVVLSLPVASAGAPIALVDAFFTAVSAACVTGLVTLDTAVAWSPFGQAVICLLFQLGGLGIMVIGAAMTLVLGQSLGPTGDATVRDVFDESNAEELRELLLAVVSWTLLIEAVGALVLFLRFLGTMDAATALSSAVFHAVSAFCNAGFSLYSDSLMQFAADPWVNFVVVTLIVLGGLGFGVLMGLRRYVLRQTGPVMSVHIKVVLFTTVVLLFGGAWLYFVFEYEHSLAHLSFRGKLLASFFQSATARTAGFNTVPLEVMQPATTLLMIALMLIGASPGSTGGGIKTTTVALVLLAARAFLTERSDVEVFGRRVPPAQILRALALMGTGVVCYVLGFCILLLTESQKFDVLAFETASALGTAGLTLGVTSELTTVGRLVVSALMFVGRVGPLTVVAAMAARGLSTARIVLPEGKVFVG